MILKDLGCRDNAELSILLTDNNGIQELNRKYLKKDKPTDVLSFPMCEMPFLSPSGGGQGEDAYCSKILLGDVVISIETAKIQAKESGITFYEEIVRLLIHGILHLLGFDHEKGGRQAQKMRKEENRLLGRVTTK